MDSEGLADTIDHGRARHLLMQQYRLAHTDAVVCSPHLFLPDGRNHPNPGIEVRYTADYGVGFPIATADEPRIYDDLLKRAAA